RSLRLVRTRAPRRGLAGAGACGPAARRSRGGGEGQYPGVDRALESDLANAAVLVRGLSLTGETLDGRPYYEEVRSSLLRELDYVQEAEQCRAYAAAARGFPKPR